MSHRLEIPIGDKKIVARIYETGSEGFGEPDELEVFIEDNTGRIQQMVCVIRQNFFTRFGDEIECVRDDSRVQCLVWEDGDTEDYTSKLYVDLIDEKEENE